MALPATDDFNRSNGSLGANWSGSVGNDLAITSNAVGPSGGSADSSMYWNADAPDAAMYAQCTHSVASGYAGALVRATATDWIILDASAGTHVWLIEHYNGGSWTQIGASYAADPQNGDVGRLEIDGNDLTAYVNGTERITGTAVTSIPATGYGGVYCYDAGDRVDDFEVGNLSSSPGGVTVSSNRMALMGVT